MIEQFLKTWKVTAIEVLPEERGVEVTFRTEGRDPIRFQTTGFAVGKRGAKSAALAKFASASGFGDAKVLFSHFCALPKNWVGDVLFGVADPTVSASPRALRVFGGEEAA